MFSARSHGLLACQSEDPEKLVDRRVRNKVAVFAFPANPDLDCVTTETLMKKLHVESGRPPSHGRVGLHEYQEGLRGGESVSVAVELRVGTGMLADDLGCHIDPTLSESTSR
jgi:hypothetical protein